MRTRSMRCLAAVIAVAPSALARAPVRHFQVDTAAAARMVLIDEATR